MLSTLGMVGMATTAMVTPAMAASTQPDLADWALFKSRFVTPDGRVVDTGNGGVSHSEGQGWGMLLAVSYGDRDTFTAIRAWTSQNLKRPRDNLHAWRYVPADRPPVRDQNNATDGDIFIATGLARAGRRWGLADHLQQAAAIARDILSLLLREVGSQAVLLPAINGFENKGSLIINPSYYAFPLLAELAQLVPSPQWDRVINDGYAMLDRGRFGRWQLPPDWMTMTRPKGVLSPAPGWPPRYSFDAVRVPLWYAWDRHPVGIMQNAFGSFWSAFPPGQVPAWVDLSNNQTAPYAMTPGMRAIMAFVRSRLTPGTIPQFPSLAEAPQYYDAALLLLSQMAWRETNGT